MPSAITVAKGSASVLDRLGLPTGQLTYSDSTLLTSATSVRAGDQFRIRLAEGGTPRVITIDKGETLTTLAAKITQFAGYQAKVEVKRQGAYDRLTITAATSRSTIELLAGDSGKDALEALGLTEGLVRSAKYDVAARQYTYGLKLDHDLKLDSADSIKATIAELQTALSTVRTAYRSLATNLDPAEAVVESAKETAKKKTVTEVPAYMKTQLANYQAGLNRLTGGG
jgi:hypothetical protein